MEQIVALWSIYSTATVFQLQDILQYLMWKTLNIA